MRRRDLDFFKKLLTHRLEELLMEAEKTKHTVKGAEELSSDPIDQASDQLDRDFLLRLRDRESKLMAKIKGSLEKIENGTFGVCEECGEAISLKRLRARPMATLCIDCKHEQEASEKKNNLEIPIEVSRLWTHG
ncbi:MAG: RNA polymerase-binding protein DksA [Syntrophobacterales bacterium]|nr:MAG: RNA polymerase-binding protein DksA [Syntrophobacterales bacterium]